VVKMIVFELFGLMMVSIFLYLVVNLLRYLFFKESAGGGFFGLSDSWIKLDKKANG